MVAANLSDLAENAHWMLNQSNAAAAAAIGRRGLAYARCYLNVDFAQEFAVEQLLAAAQRNADAGANAWGFVPRGDRILTPDLTVT